VQFLPAVELEPDDSTYIQVMTCIVQPDPDTHTYMDIHPQLESDTGGWVARVQVSGRRSACLLHQLKVNRTCILLFE
jgi:hypothetical protein